MRRKQKFEDEKNFNLKMPKEMWTALKREALEKDVTMTSIVFKLLERHQKREELKKIDQQQ